MAFIEKIDDFSMVFSFVIFYCVMEYVPSNCFITCFRTALSVLVGLCCPAFLKLYRCKCAYCCIIAKFHYTGPTGPDQTKSADFVGDPGLRPGSPTKSSGSARVRSGPYSGILSLLGK